MHYNVATVETFGKWLYQNRKDQGLTQLQVAERAGLSFSYVSTLERMQPHTLTGKKILPTRERVEALAKAVNGNVDEALRLCGYAPATHAHHINGFKIDLPDDIEFVIPYSPHVTSQEQADQFRDAILTAYTITKERLAKENA